MEAKYVTEAVGEALALGLAEVVAVKPTDPIEYLGNWMKKHRGNQLQRERAQKELEGCLHTSEDKVDLEAERQSPTNDSNDAQQAK